MMILATVLAAMAQASGAAPEVRLWRLDCGTIEAGNFSYYSDTGRYDGQARRMAVSCYLIRHGDEYMLWDAGLSGRLEGRRETVEDMELSVRKRIVPQLAEIGVAPAQVRYVGISHRHWDHSGQASDFPDATLLIGAEDLEALDASTDADDRAGVLPWLEGGAKARPLIGDHDVFGDRTVVMVDLPGHTPGHHGLYVRLKEKGVVLLSGDQFHARESYDTNQVPAFNDDRADTLASSDRFRRIAEELKATVIIQHEPGDVALLPQFPESAR